jgi:AcrR family transcriptional regulator
MTGGTAIRGAAIRGTAIRGTAILLGAGCVVWATAPPVHRGYADFALFLAILGVAAGALRLALAAVPVPEDNYLLPAPRRVWLWFLQTLRLVPWEEGALIAILWLEVLHPARPWHTAFLGAALIGYLLATHLAESGASPEALRPQVRVLAVGAGLLALGAGAGMVPAVGPGAGSALLRVVAAAALIAAAGLVLPYVAAPGPPPGGGRWPERK